VNKIKQLKKGPNLNKWAVEPLIIMMMMIIIIIVSVILMIMFFPYLSSVLYIRLLHFLSVLLILCNRQSFTSF
jgi:hypothetical protein